MTTSICLTEASQRIREHLSQLREELAELFEKREFMISYERDHLTAIYTELIGKLLYEEFALKTAIQKLKRKVELIQAKINRGEKVNLETIERMVEDEFAEYQRRLQEQLNQIKAAQELLSSPALSEEETEEMKVLYRALVKRLHPDWNPDLSDVEKDLFLRAQAAYKLCDLQELRNILLRCENKSFDDLTHEDGDAEIIRLEKSLEDLRLRIDKLNASFPFNHRDKLADKNWVDDEQARILKSINKLTEEKGVWSVYASSQMNSYTELGQA